MKQFDVIRELIPHEFIHPIPEEKKAHVAAKIAHYIHTEFAELYDEIGRADSLDDALRSRIVEAAATAATAVWQQHQAHVNAQAKG